MAAARAHALGQLLLAAAAGGSYERHAPPRAPLSLPRPHPLPWISLSFTHRTGSSPPTDTTAATSIPTPSQLVPELRLLALNLSTEGSEPGWPPSSHRRLLHHRPPRIFTVDSPPSSLPRAR